MPETEKARARHDRLLPRLAEAFGATGYRRTTTAQLAETCGLQETQLYRLWPSKKAMFLAVIGHLYELETADWKRALAQEDHGDTVRDVLDTEGRLRGKSGLHRITLAALSESDDPEIHTAVQKMYRQFHRFIRDALKTRHAQRPADAPAPLDPSLAAWALIGLGTMTNIGREFDLFSPATQRKLMTRAGLALAEGAPPPNHAG